MENYKSEAQLLYQELATASGLACRYAKERLEVAKELAHAQRDLERVTKLYEVFVADSQVFKGCKNEDERKIARIRADLAVKTDPNWAHLAELRSRVEALSDADKEWRAKVEIAQQDIAAIRTQVTLLDIILTYVHEQPPMLSAEKKVSPIQVEPKTYTTFPPLPPF
ncbi:hypothetical protein ANRL1_02251 [Anaerolineae bacterium]|nr:hypothetical protein ANRL1_02251 [Anaerolineae bacterium]